MIYLISLANYDKLYNFFFTGLVISDHGNIEDITTDVHTLNRVPVLVWGKNAGDLTDKIKTLEDVTPPLLQLLETANA